MKHTKLLVVALLVALLACLAMSATAETPHGLADPSSCIHPSYAWIVDDKLTVKPTCVTMGLTVYQCTLCGTTVNTVQVPATGNHSWNDPETKAADCGNNGYTRRTCKVCGYAETTVIAASGNHDFSDVYAAKVAPTCIEAGADTWYKCSVCGKVGPKPAVLPATGHNYDGVAWSPVREATCATDGLLARQCKNTYVDKDGKTQQCGYVDYMNVGKTSYHTDSNFANGKTQLVGPWDKTANNGRGGWALKVTGTPIIAPTAPTCTADGCTAVFQCSVCGATKGGEKIAAPGHQMDGQPWEVLQDATCGQEGYLARYCSVCSARVETKNVGKTSYHTDKVFNAGSTTVGSTWDKTQNNGQGGYALTVAPGYIIAAKAPTCTENGCKAVYQCSECGATKGGETIPAQGHKILDSKWEWKNGVVANCTTSGVRTVKCEICGKTASEVTVPAYGHTAVWQISQAPTANATGMAILKCTRCDQTIGMQILKAGDTLPYGVVNTGAAASAAANSTAKTSTTKTTTAKSSSTKSASTSASTKTAAAPATTETKKVATVAAVAAPAAELEANQAQLVADKHLYVVKNVAGEEIVLTVNVADGKITVEAALAEGESLVLYANAEAIENPTAENTLVLTANEAVELPEAFANAIVAVVKTESLPTAVAAK